MRSMHYGLKSICVFCGSSFGARAEYRAAAEATGKAIAGAGLTLVYGGGNIGLMGAMADAALAAGGKVIGVIPEALDKIELGHERLTELKVVKTMHERKALMADLADAFIALPGGIGTLEEFAEVVTWAHLEIHQKPCGLLNTLGYYSDLMKFLDKTVEEKFFPAPDRGLIMVSEDPNDLLKQIMSYKAPTKGKLPDMVKRDKLAGLR